MNSWRIAPWNFRRPGFRVCRADKGRRERSGTMRIVRPQGLSPGSLLRARQRAAPLPLSPLLRFMPPVFSACLVHRRHYVRLVLFI